jgi:hypothetical protein
MADHITVVNMIPNSLSGETNQDSEPNLAVNPANRLEIAGTAFTPSPNVGSPDSPIFFSNNGGNTWNLIDLIAGTPVRDQTLRFATSDGMLYAAVLWGTGSNIALINFDILRTNDFSGATTMTRLARRQNDDQPFVQAATVPTGADAGKDRIYVGSNDHAPANTPATIDQSLDAAAAAPTTQTLVIEGRTVVRDGFQTRPAIHLNGTVYALFYALITGASNCDVVIVRDDNWASGATKFRALIDPGDSKQGVRIATGVNNPFLGMNIGQQRIGGDLSIAVDPNNGAHVYVCWGELQGSTYTVRVRKSTDSGATWPGPDLRTITNATNPALAINSKGRLGFLYQQVTGAGANQRWETTLELTHSDFASITTHILASTPAGTPASTFQPYLGDYLYMMAVGETFYGIFSANNTPDKANFPNGVRYQRNANFTTHTLLNLDNVTPVSVSIDPFFFKVTAGIPVVATAIANHGFVGNVCLHSFVDGMLTINNKGTGTLWISNISSTSADFEAPGVLSYPLEVEPGDSIDVMVRFRPTSHGFKAGKIEIFSNAPFSPHVVDVSGECSAPLLRLMIADRGDFGSVCRGCFVDEPLILTNAGKCTLTVSGITSSLAEFAVPEVLAYPITIGPGDALPVPIRFEPASFGVKSAIITVTSDDPASPATIKVFGDAPSGKLTVAGSTCFGGVTACCCADRTISICNTGKCDLNVTSVAFKRKSRHWRLINNPFPALLRAGSCLPVVIQYRATERCSRPCELVIESDDPMTPVKSVDVLAYTVWDDGCCKEHCEDCGKGCCEKSHKESCCQQGYPCCEEDDDGDS